MFDDDIEESDAAESVVTDYVGGWVDEADGDDVRDVCSAWLVVKNGL